MLEKKIVLSNLENVRQFVAAANDMDYDVDLYSGKYIVNGKSIMGIFSLDLTKPIKMVAHCDGENTFIEKIKAFIIED